MLDRIFNSDNVVFRFLTTLGYVWWLHILWLICCLPVITIGASTTALCYSCMKLRRQEGYVTRNFFTSFWKNFKQATVLFVILAVVGAVLFIDLSVASQIHTASGEVLLLGIRVLLIPYGVILLYVFAIQASFVNPVIKTLGYAFVLGSKYIISTLKLFLIVAVVVLLNQTIVLANFLTLSMGVGILFYVMAGIWNKVFERYMS